MSAVLYIGLMSGTSLDGIDVAIAELGGEEERPKPPPSTLDVLEKVPFDKCRKESLRQVLAGFGIIAFPANEVIHGLPVGIHERLQGLVTIRFRSGFCL